MANKTIEELKSEAAVVRDATEEGENTATRVGNALIDMIDTLSESVSINAIKGYVVIDSTSELPANPTAEQQQKGYLLDTTLYVYVGTGGDTLDGKYQSAELKGPQGATGPAGADGHDGVSLGEVALVNNLKEGGEQSALTAEMGKKLNEKMLVNEVVYASPKDGGDYMICTYNITDISGASTLISSTTGFNAMSIDGGADVSVAKTYQFSETGTHVVKFKKSSTATATAQFQFNNISILIAVKLPSGMATITGMTFNSCSGLKEITFGSSCSTIANNYINGTNNTTKLLLSSTTPPTFNGNFGSSLSSIVVPSAAINSYKTTANWSNKASIITDGTTDLNGLLYDASGNRVYPKTRIGQVVDSSGDAVFSESGSTFSSSSLALTDDNFDGVASESSDYTCDINHVDGDNVNVAVWPTSMLRMLNSAKLIKQMIDNRVRLNSYYNHEPNMVKLGDKMYVTYDMNTSGTTETWNDTMKTVLSVVDIATMTVDNTYDIAKKNDTIGTATISSWAGSPNIAVVNDKVRVIFRAMTTQQVIAYRDFDPTDSSLGSLTQCQFVDSNNDTYDLTKTNFDTYIESGGTDLQAHCQYALHNSTYYITIGNGVSGKNGNIFTTTDFATFTYWGKPTIPALGDLGFRYELALCTGPSAQGEKLYFALRRSTDLLVGIMNYSTKAVEHYRSIPYSESRPAFFLRSGALYMMYVAAGQASYRQFCSLVKFKQNSLEGPCISIVAQCGRNTYPSFVVDGTTVYLASQSSVSNSSQSHVFLTKFNSIDHTFDDVVPLINRIVQLF